MVKWPFYCRRQKSLVTHTVFRLNYLQDSLRAISQKILPICSFYVKSFDEYTCLHVAIVGDGYIKYSCTTSEETHVKVTAPKSFLYSN